MKDKIRVTVWNENIHERGEGAWADVIRNHYPHGIHNALKEELASPDLEIRAVALDDPEQGLPQDVLENTDTLVWWGHCGHHLVEDSLVDRIQKRVLEGMGLVVLHSGHYSKIFRRMLGTHCSLRWREVGEKERVWVVDKDHPIAQGVPDSFVIPHTEMYGEPFGIPGEAHVVFMSWYEGGNVFRSGVTFRRGQGKIFYFSPGHETFPIYRQPEVVKVIGNAVRWAAQELPNARTVCWDKDPALEPVTSENPMDAVDTSSLHAKA
ncbi:MAG: ThuA domain-containing protein [Kiritimatiellae bacterium]|nr:ThuA domain-containing protein [Kiritimatiellia bacterium]